MKTRGLALTMLVFLTLSSFSQETEKRFGFELNSGASIATTKIGGASLKPGFGFEGTFHYRFMPHLGVYTGWGWNRFGAEESFAGNDVCFEETGYVFGLNFNHPIGTSKLAYYLRIGALYNHIETENSEGDIINDTKHGFGYQLAGGIDINLGKNWSFTPGLKFNILSRETEYEGTTIKIDYQYISARIGITKKF
ncbi:MAG: porin family protein [Deferribacterales bacterium]|nr:porin family protein [Deferribacterales bacterium]